MTDFKLRTQSWFSEPHGRDCQRIEARLSLQFESGPEKPAFLFTPFGGSLTLGGKACDKAGLSEPQMPNKAHSVVTRVTELIEPILREMGFELVDVEYLNAQGRWVLRIYVDKEEGGVTLDDCATVSGEIGDLIDVKDIIRHRYMLEVSSPGLDRPLKREKDFFRAMGKKIRVKTRVPIEGRRNFTGVLDAFEDDRVGLALDDGRVSIPLGNVEKARLVYDFGNP